MKAMILALTLLVAGICASIIPEPSIEPGTIASPKSGPISGPIEDTIIEAIEEISQAIRNDGLDPLHVEKENFVYQLPVPVIFNAAAFVEDILSTGLSDIVVNEMNYSVLLSRLNFEIELPHIHLSARVAYGDVTLFGRTLVAEADGRVNIRGTTAKGVVRVYLGIISGISIRSVDIDFNLGQITSNIRLAIQGDNYSQDINDFISQTVPATLKEFKDEVDELIAIVVLDLINENLFP